MTDEPRIIGATFEPTGSTADVSTPRTIVHVDTPDGRCRVLSMWSVDGRLYVKVQRADGAEFVHPVKDVTLGSITDEVQ